MKRTNVTKQSVMHASYAQKQHLASVLSEGMLNSEQLGRVVMMIREGVVGLKDSCEEIELDIEVS